MGEGKLKNKICDTIDDIRQLKIDIIIAIRKLNSKCVGYPPLIIDTSLPSININFAVINFLRDILAILGGLKINEIRALIIDWLINNLQPALKRIVEIIKQAIKECFTCKINPQIPGWLFTAGINIELEQIDRDCMFRISPSSEAGKLYYGNNTDMNRFLWDVIQSPGPLTWTDPNSNRPIGEFNFIKNGAYVSGIAGEAQDSDPRNNVFNMKIDASYSGKSLTTFINDYMDSQVPLFDLERVIPNTIDLLYGSITSKINIPEECVTKKIEFEKGLEKLIDNGLDDPEVIVDNTFFEFTTPEVKNIKDLVRNNKKGEKVFTECCSKATASVNMETLTDLNEKLSNGNLTNSQKAGVIDKSMREMQEQTTNNVAAADKDKANADFIGNFINSLSIVTTKLTLSPKTNFPMITMGYLVEGKSRFGTTNEFLKFFLCIIRNILGDLLEKLIYGFLLPLILKYIRPLLICILQKLINEKKEQLTLSIESLLPGNRLIKEETRDKITKALGGASKQIGKLNDINIPKGLEKIGINKPDGKFCDDKK
jgi:hypothetical protein